MERERLLIKICGLSTPTTLEAALKAGADMIGLVHFEKSPRHLDLDRIGALADQARGRALIVVLTVDADDELLSALNAATNPDFFQLHGQETPQRVRDVKRAFGKAAIKAVGVGTHEDVRRAEVFAGTADLLLFDAKPPKEATRPGGLGTPFDWSVLDSSPVGKRFLLSGGLGPTNVGKAIDLVKPHGVDVSSGVEEAPGLKNERLIADFIAAARRAAAEKIGSGMEKHSR